MQTLGRSRRHRQRGIVSRLRQSPCERTIGHRRQIAHHRRLRKTLAAARRARPTLTPGDVSQRKIVVIPVSLKNVLPTHARTSTISRTVLNAAAVYVQDICRRRDGLRTGLWLLARMKNLSWLSLSSVSALSQYNPSCMILINEGVTKKNYLKRFGLCIGSYVVLLLR